MAVQFRDRHDAGRRLAEHLQEYAGRDDVVVLALPRGGVPVAYEVARALDADLDLMIVRKLGVPGHEELAMGAIATSDALVLNEDTIRQLAISRDAVERVIAQEREELQRRAAAYRDNRPPMNPAGRCVILVDDGLATGSTMLAAVQALKQSKPAEIVIAVPVAPPETCRDLQQHVDRIVCIQTPSWFGGVGRWYADFSQTTDQEVKALLGDAWQKSSAAPDYSVNWPGCSYVPPAK